MALTFSVEGNMSEGRSDMSANTWYRYKGGNFLVMPHTTHYSGQKQPTKALAINAEEGYIGNGWCVYNTDDYTLFKGKITFEQE